MECAHGAQRRRQEQGCWRCTDSPYNRIQVRLLFPWLLLMDSAEQTLTNFGFTSAQQQRNSTETVKEAGTIPMPDSPIRPWAHGITQISLSSMESFAAPSLACARTGRRCGEKSIWINDCISGAGDNCRERAPIERFIFPTSSLIVSCLPIFAYTGICHDFTASSNLNDNRTYIVVFTHHEPEISRIPNVSALPRPTDNDKERTTLRDSQ